MKCYNHCNGLLFKNVRDVNFLTYLLTQVAQILLARRVSRVDDINACM